MKTRIVTSAGVVALLAGSASAQLLVGNDDNAADATNAWNVNPNTAAATPLWDAPEVWGMAYDGATNTVYANDGVSLHGGPLGSGGPPLLGEITFQGSSISVVGLAFGGGGLYATRNVGEEAVYQIDPETLDATIALDYEDADFDFGGLAFNPDDGLFYGTSDDSTPGRGLYSIDVFGDGGINFVAPYPAGRTDIDGLAIGNGVAYLVEDEAGDTIHPYVFKDGGYLPSIANPMTSSEIFSGAAWVPAPTSLGVLALGGLFAGRRRR